MIRFSFLLVFIILVMPGVAVRAQTAQERLSLTIQQMENAALQGDDATFVALRQSLEKQNTPEAYVALGKLFSNIPTKYVLRVKRYEDAAKYYQLAIARGAELNQDTKTVSEARIGLARMILQNRIPGREYDKAVAMLEQAVQSGNSNAAYVLGRWLERGVNKDSPDYKQAEYWYRYALRGEIGEAAIALVSLYRRGYIVPPSKSSRKQLSALGVSLLRQRADRGDSTAAYRLGRIYSLGLGVKSDTKEARKWYDLSAALGSLAALKELAVISSRDENDRVKAANYMLKAAEGGSVVAAVELGKKLTRSEGYYLDISNEVAQLWVERAASLGNITAIDILTDRLLAQGKTSEAIAYLERAANQGSMDSYLTLYQLYKSGQGVEKDDQRARRYFNAAVQARELRSFEKEKLGLLMLQPTEPIFDTARGLKLLNDAANAGSTNAMAYLANLYAKGTILPSDPKKVLFWREKAAVAGDVGSMLALSQIYEEGMIVPQDRKKANILLNRTLNNVSLDDAKAMMTIGQAYVSGQVVATDMDEAAEWFRRAMDAGNVEAMVALGRLVKWNAVKVYNPTDAVGLFQRAANSGSESALVELGLLYSMGMLVPLDPAMAFEYFRMAAEGGSYEGMRQVGLAYLGGIGIDQDSERGIRFLRQAAANGNAEAMLDLGNLSAMRGNQTDAVRQWKEAARANIPDAYYFLALAYREGRGVERNARMADDYLKTAAKLDSFQAQLALKNLDVAAF